MSPFALSDRYFGERALLEIYMNTWPPILAYNLANISNNIVRKQCDSCSRIV